MGKIVVKKAGLQSSFQDLGRHGYADIGISEAGALDEYSFNTLNLLLGNFYATNMIEITLGGFEFQVISKHTMAAFTGANTPILLNNKPIKMWQSHFLKSGDIVKIGFAANGQRFYFGVSGGFEIEKTLGSFSSSIKENLGANPLKNGDTLSFTCKDFLERRVLKKEYIPNYENNLTLRVIQGYQFDTFSDENKEIFFNSTYEVTPQSNRMGFRLQGEPLKNVQKGIISEGISFGAIQIPSDGQPIVLLKERQTIGGYPKLGSLLPIDCFKLSQCKPKTKVTFKPISLSKATKLMKEFYDGFKFYM